MAQQPQPSRRFTRWGVSLACLFRHEGAVHKGRMHDLSEGGAFLESSVCPAKGARITLALKSADGQRQFNLGAEVRHRSSIKTPRGKLLGFGVEFRNLTPQAVADIEQLIIRHGQVSD
ncbi:MAG TPA: PilZ domain-containing protein [Acidobacteriota bacterium]|nr:PilZ domain-containing protein [Acidobacteriota bacterium]